MLSRLGPECWKPNVCIMVLGTTVDLTEAFLFRSRDAENCDVSAIRSDVARWGYGNLEFNGSKGMAS